VSVTIKADGDTWQARLGGREDGRLVVFFCVTTDQRPYRVVPVAGGVSSETDLEALSGTELDALFARSRSMGAPTDYPTYRS